MDALPDEKLSPAGASQPPAAATPKSSSAVIVHIGADVDVAALEEDIRAEVTRKEQAGIYPPELLFEIGGDPVRDSMEALRGAAELSIELPTQSARPGLGRLVSLVKRLIARTLRWHTRWLVDQMQAFAGSTIAALAATQDRLEDLERRLDGSSERRNPQGVPSLASAPWDLGDWNALRLRELATRPGLGKIACLGCGHGSLLAALSDAGADCYGVESDPELARSCRERGLDVRDEEMLEHLLGVPRGSLAAIVADAGDRLDAAGLEDLFRRAAAALAPEGILMVEVPAGGGFQPSGRAERTLGLPFGLLAERAGFRQVRVDRPVPTDRRLRPLPEPNGSTPEPLAAALNANLRLIDEALFGPQVVRILARR